MRRLAIASLALLTFGIASAQTAAAQGYDPCRRLSNDRTGAGAIVGGLIGGAIGNGVASSGTREEGTAIGALLGAAIGAGIAGNSTDCDTSSQFIGQGFRDTRQTGFGYGQQYGQPYGQGYSQGGYGYNQYGHDPYGSNVLAGGPGYSGYDYGPRYAGYPAPNPRDRNLNRQWTEYRNDGYGSSYSSGQAQCETVTRVTRLPDGRELREPVQACREPVYTDWQLNR
jgi:hypothetical protein